MRVWTFVTPAILVRDFAAQLCRTTILPRATVHVANEKKTAL